MPEHNSSVPPVDSIAVFRIATRLLAFASRVGAFGCCFAVADASKQHLEPIDAVSIVGVLALGCFAVRGQWLGPAIAAAFAAVAVHYGDDTGAMGGAFDPDGAEGALLPLGLLLLSGACILEVLVAADRRLPAARAALLVGAGVVAYGIGIAITVRLLSNVPPGASAPSVGPPWNGLLVAVTALPLLPLLIVVPIWKAPYISMVVTASGPLAAQMRHVVPLTTTRRLRDWQHRALAVDPQLACPLSEALPSIVLAMCGGELVALGIDHTLRYDAVGVAGGAVVGFLWWSALYLSAGRGHAATDWGGRMLMPAGLLLASTALSVMVVGPLTGAVAWAEIPGVTVLTALAWFFLGRPSWRWAHSGFVTLRSVDPAADRRTPASTGDGHVRPSSGTARWPADADL